MITEKDNVVLVENATNTDLQKIQTKYDLNKRIFNQSDSAIEVSRFISIHSNVLDNAHLFVSFSMQEFNTPIEDSLVPVITIFNQEKLLVVSSKNILQFKYSTNPYEMLLNLLLAQSSNIAKKLSLIKEEIDYLDQAARKTTKTKELKKLTDLTREVVYLKHTLEDQKQDLFRLLDYLQANNLVNSSLITSVKTEQRRLNKKIQVYSDLLNSISGLFNAMMDSHLNHLMKFLDSAALIISIPALISGIWGMNVGGLPGKNDDNGFWLIIFLGGILALIAWILLKNKDYDS